MYADDPEHFNRECVTIKSKSGQLMPLEWNAAQRLLHERLEDQKARTGKVRALVPKARQMGVSTYVAARYYAGTTLHKGRSTYILTHEDLATKNLFNMARRIHEHVPEDIRVPADLDNANQLYFGGIESGYEIGTARTKAKGRSQTIQLFHGSEVAHWANGQDNLAGVMQAIPDEEGTEAILESTANGIGGLFYEMCMEALVGEGEYELCFLPWFMDKGYEKEPPPNWDAPAEWRTYLEQYDLEDRQLFWAFAKNRELAKGCGGSIEEPCWLFRQEYPATIHEAFQTSGEHSFISPEIVLRARQENYPEPGANTPLIFGVDIAHGGGDKTHIIDRCGRRLGHLVNETIDEPDEMTIAGYLVTKIDEFRPEMVFVDTTGGYGAGVVDRLKEQGYRNIRGVNFGSKARDAEKYANKRAEMWGELNEWLKEGADIVDDATIQRDLCAPTAKPDSSGRLILERKDDIRKRLAFSPDVGDASALTFAERVRPKGPQRPAPQRANSNYNPLGRWHA
ncbi:MAG: hypothetical protein VCF07_00710 [Nitrospinota bacterium]